MRRVHLKLSVEISRRDGVRVALVHPRRIAVVLEMQYAARSCSTVVHSLVLCHVGSSLCAFILAKEVRCHWQVFAGRRDDVLIQIGTDTKIDLSPAPWKSLCEAIRRGDEEIVREESLHLEGPLTIPAKREAILGGRQDFLKLLLDRDDTIDDSTVATACDRKDRTSVRILFDFGWPINKSVYCTASLLWLV